MFCRQCGSEVPNGGKFCAKCGCKMENGGSGRSDAGDFNVMPVENPNLVPCPRCMSQKLHKISYENYIFIRRDYGLIRGLIKKLTHSIGKMFTKKEDPGCYKCEECGHEFLSVQGMIIEKERDIVLFMCLTVLCILGAIVGFADGEVFIGVISCFFGLGGIGGVFESRKDCDDLKCNGYQASCYKSELKK